MIFRRQKKNLSRREIVAQRRQSASVKTDTTSIGNNTRRFQKNRAIAVKRVGESDLTERQAWHNLRQKRRRLFTVLVGVLVGAGVVMLALTQFAGSIAVQTTTPIDKKIADGYEDLLGEYFAERLTERFRWLVNNDALNEFFFVRAPEVKRVAIMPGSELATVSLRLEFREPVAQWTSGEKTYFVDDSGVTFEQNFFEPPRVVVKDESNIQAEAGVEVINQRSLAFLGHMVSGFRDHDMTVQEVVLPDSTLRTMNVLLEGRVTVVQMTIDRDADAQVQEAILAFQYLDGKGQAPEHMIVSVDQRVFYR